MTTSLETLEQTLTRIELLSQEIMQRMVISGQQVVVIGGLSDISEDLGLVKAGEFRVGKGTPNVASDKFTGVRIGSPGWLYSGKRYAIVGVNDDVLQFGLSTEDGRIYAGAGDILMDADGITLAYGLTKKTIRWMSSGTETARIQVNQALPGQASFNIWTDETWVGSFDTWWGLQTNKIKCLGFAGFGDDVSIGGELQAYQVSITDSLRSYKNSTFYPVYGYAPLIVPVGSATFTGGGFSTTAKTELTVTTEFSGIPAGVKALDVYVALRDSGSAANDCYFILGGDNTAGRGRPFDCSGLANDSYERDHAIVPVDSNGKIFYQIQASGAGTMDISVLVCGYWI